jgi:hypothetical protein
MSVLNVNMPERDLDPEELELEQDDEDAFGTFLLMSNLGSEGVVPTYGGRELTIQIPLLMDLQPKHQHSHGS